MARKTVYSRESLLLAKALREARRRAAVHQTQVAEKMGVDQTIISNVERGQRRIDMVEFFHFAKAIGAEPTDLFEAVITEWEREGIVLPRRGQNSEHSAHSNDGQYMPAEEDRERLDRKLRAFFAQTDALGLNPLELSQAGQMAYFALNPVAERAASIKLDQEWSVDFELGRRDETTDKDCEEAFGLIDSFLAQKFKTVSMEAPSASARRYLLRAIV